MQHARAPPGPVANPKRYRPSRFHPPSHDVDKRAARTSQFGEDAEIICALDGKNHASRVSGNARFMNAGLNRKRSGTRCDVGDNVVRLVQLAHDEKHFTCSKFDDNSDDR
jgi:hypothetical protein